MKFHYVLAKILVRDKINELFGKLDEYTPYIGSEAYENDEVIRLWDREHRLLIFARQTESTDVGEVPLATIEHIRLHNFELLKRGIADYIYDHEIAAIASYPPKINIMESEEVRIHERNGVYVLEIIQRQLYDNPVEDMPKIGCTLSFRFHILLACDKQLTPP